MSILNKPRGHERFVDFENNGFVLSDHAWDMIMAQVLADLPPGRIDMETLEPVVNRYIKALVYTTRLLYCNYDQADRLMDEAKSKF